MICVSSISRAGGLGVGDRDQRRARLDHGLAEPGGAAGGAGAGRGDEEERLAGIEDLAVGEQPVVMDDRADIVLAGNVGGGEDGDHAGRGPHRVEIQRDAGWHGLRSAWPKAQWSTPGGSGRSST